eukprot:466450-Pyramimonas_sp.AAC.1
MHSNEGHVVAFKVVNSKNAASPCQGGSSLCLCSQQEAGPVAVDCSPLASLAPALVVLQLKRAVLRGVLSILVSRMLRDLSLLLWLYSGCTALPDGPLFSAAYGG